jgi:hypothetical protein
MSDAQENAACAEFMQQVRDFMKKSTERHDALERRLRESLAPTIEEHGDRLDRHDSQLRMIQANIERLANRMTVQEGLLEKTFTVLNRGEQERQSAGRNPREEHRHRRPDVDQPAVHRGSVMENPETALLVLVAAIPTIISFIKWAAERWVNRADKREEQVEASETKKLDAVLVGVTELKQEFAVMGTKLLQQAASVDALRGRIDGISAAHGPKLDSLAERVTRVETQLEERLPRFAARGA